MRCVWKILVPLWVAVLASGCGPAPDEALVTLDIPADPHAPVVADVVIDGHIHPLVVDTGASEIIFDLAVAQRMFKPSPERDSGVATGLHGDVPVQRFATGRPLVVGDWRLRTEGTVMATDLSALMAETGAHGVLGMTALAGLDWLWDNQRRRLQGFAPGDRRFTAATRGLQCVEMLSYDGIPGIEVALADGTRGVFLLDTGDLMASGGLSDEDLETLQAQGALETSFLSPYPQRDAAGAEVGRLRMASLRGVHLGAVALDGLVMHAQRNASRLGRGFFAKPDRVALDFQDFRMCMSADAPLSPDALEDYR